MMFDNERNIFCIETKKTKAAKEISLTAYKNCSERGS